MDTICLKCEIITLLQDLRFAWDRGFPSVCYEIDNTQVVEVVCSSICPPPHQYAHLLLQNFQFINRKWHLSFIHIEREANEATLTNVGVNQCQPFCTWTLYSLLPLMLSCLRTLSRVVSLVIFRRIKIYIITLIKHF